MNARNTTERVLERYHTYVRRPDRADPAERRRLFRGYQRVLGPWLPENRSAPILDVACGDGSLLAFLRELGYTSLSGFDLSPENVELCHRAGLRNVRQFNALHLVQLPLAERFDTIFAIDMLEHLPQRSVAGFVEQVRERLLPGGQAIFQTPNMGSLYASFYRYSDLTHEFGVTEKSAVDLLRVAGFDLERIQVTPAWNAVRPAGYLREMYARFVHRFIFLGDGVGRPKIGSTNLLIRGINK